MSDDSAKTKSWLRRKTSDWWGRLISIKAPAGAIALGFAVGAFMTAHPIAGYHSIACVAICALVRANVPAGLLASWISNPVTYPLVVIADYEIGCAVLGRPRLVIEWANLTWETVWQEVPRFIVPLLAGSAILGVLAAVPSYFLVRRAVERYRNGQTAVPDAGEARR